MGKEKLEHYVEFFLCGLPSSSYAIMEVITPEISTVKVSSRDPNKVRAPEEAFGYRFFDRQEYITSDREVLVGLQRNISGMYYFGKIITPKNVAKEVASVSTLISIMKEKGYRRVVRTRRGNFQPLQKDDVVVAER